MALYAYKIVLATSKTLLFDNEFFKKIIHFILGLFVIVLQFELEALPLKLWPVPKKFSAEVVEVTTFIKVTKEYILFGLMSHKNKQNSDIQFFVMELMPQVVANLAVMSSDIALRGLRDLKEKCPFATGGFRVSKDCWKLHDLLEGFYSRHQW
jgi:hypothetical protein